MEELALDRDAHIRYCLRCLRMLPHQYQVEDSGRMALAYFCLASLSSLKALDRLSDDERRGYVDWVFHRWRPDGGFAGGCNVVEKPSPSFQDLDPPHLVYTYTALLVLGLLAPTPKGGTFVRVDQPRLLAFVQSCQRSDGSFAPFPASTESDVRFVYCALAIYSMLGRPDECSKSINLAISFLARCRRYDGGYAQEPHLESHGGSTYCAVASLQLVGRLASALSPDDIEETRRWLVNRQVEYIPEEEDNEEEDRDEGVLSYKVSAPLTGFQGRPGKPPDACYSFWCGAALSILAHDNRAASDFRAAPPTTMKGESQLYDALGDRKHLLACQSGRWGGIARAVGDFADVYHTYLSLAALSVGGASPELAELDPALNVEASIAQGIRESLSEGREGDKRTLHGVTEDAR